jgi:hypothetical protein
MNQIGLQYIYTWKYYKGTTCVAVLNKQNLFSFTKSVNRRIEQVLPWVRGGWYQLRGEEMGKGYGRVNIVQILCTHVWKWKKDTC